MLDLSGLLTASLSYFNSLSEESRQHLHLLRRLKRSLLFGAMDAASESATSAFVTATTAADDEGGGTTQADLDICHTNCSGRGDCVEGICYCQIQFDGESCENINFEYHMAFASIFFLIALTSLVQLVMCIHAEYLRMKKHPSILRACRVTTQKLLYFLVFCASLLRGAFFAAPALSSEWSISLMSAYYPVLLTGASLIVCFWAEVFHLREIRWDRPRFLSKSFLGFLTFNIITYSLLAAEMFLVSIEHEDQEFYSHIFNGCYAGLMFIVVVFFLIYGVEVFFKVRGGFTIPKVTGVISTRSRSPPIVKQSSRPLMAAAPEQDRNNLSDRPQRANECSSSVREELLVPAAAGKVGKNVLQRVAAAPESNEQRAAGYNVDIHTINTSQLHQSRFGLISQAIMMFITVGFLFSETLEKFWKTKVDLASRNTHDIIFHTVEIGIALWFPCVLWNCIRPEQLWCLNPKKIIDQIPPLRDVRGATRTGESKETDSTDEEDDSISCGRGPECWICYDMERTDAGPMINPCNCRGDVGAVHHDCLRRWLVESADNPDALQCKVCNAEYQVEKGSQFSLAQGFTLKQWIITASIVTLMCLTLGGCWTVVQLYSEPWIRMLAVGSSLLIQYICLRSLGLNTVSAYQRAKVSALKIVNLKRGGKAPEPPQRRGSQASTRHPEYDIPGTYNLNSLRSTVREQSRI